jgi:hypothetical protein
MLFQHYHLSSRQLLSTICAISNMVVYRIYLWGGEVTQDIFWGREVTVYTLLNKTWGTFTLINLDTISEHLSVNA